MIDTELIAENEKLRGVIAAASDCLDSIDARDLDEMASAPESAYIALFIRDARKRLASVNGVAFCDHGIAEGDWCPACNVEMKAARAENGDLPW